MTSFPKPEEEQSYGFLDALRDAILNRRRLAEKGTEQALKYGAGFGDVPRQQPQLPQAPTSPQEDQFLNTNQPLGPMQPLPGGMPDVPNQGYPGHTVGLSIAPSGILKGVNKLMRRGKGVKEAGDGHVYRAPEGFEDAPKPETIQESIRKRLDESGGEIYRASPGTDFTPEVSNSLAPKAFREAGEGGIYRAPEEGINPNIVVPPQFNLEDIARAIGKRVEDVTQADVDRAVRMLAP